MNEVFCVKNVRRVLAAGVWTVLWVLPLWLPTHALTAQDAAAILAAIEEGTTTAIAKAERSVVAISRVSQQRHPADRAGTNRLSLDLPLGLQDPLNDPDFVPTFFGTGVVISEQGHIVTCAHVLDDPRKNDYYVWLDRRSYPAQVVGMAAKVLASDPFSDLAVLKVDNAPGLQPIEFGEVADLRKGQFVIALGNPDAIARDGQASASWGIISNLSRVAPSDSGETSVVKDSIHQYGTLIQTDAKLNFGTSGGALIDLQGRMIGLTTSLAAKLGNESSAGFAIAADKLFLRVVSQLKLGKLPEYGFLGIQPEDLRTSERERGMQGARVSVVLQGLPGDRAGLRAEDVIIQVGDEPIFNRNDLFRELSAVPAGHQVELLVHRPRADIRRQAVLRLTAEVSKKPIQSSRTSYAVHANPSWRGLSVDYATASTSELAQFGIWRGKRDEARIAVSAVEPDTPAWRSGIRAGNGILTVNGREIRSPDDFYKQVQDAEGAIILELVRQNGVVAKIEVPDLKQFD
jgi:serine protease Do